MRSRLGCHRWGIRATGKVLARWQAKGKVNNRTYPFATDSDVQDEIEGLLGQTLPDIEVADASTRDLVELVAVAEPSDGLSLPVVGRAVPNRAPRVPVLVRDASGAADALALVADAAGVDVAVDGSVSRQLAVDRLENVHLSARRPGSTLTDRLAQGPEGGPDALLVLDRAGAEADLGLGQGTPACLGGEGVPGLDAARCPSAGGAALSPWDKLEGLAAALLHIAGVVPVVLKLAVNTQVAVDDVPDS